MNYYFKFKLLDSKYPSIDQIDLEIPEWNFEPLVKKKINNDSILNYTFQKNLT